MAKEGSIEVDGVVQEALPNAMFRASNFSRNKKAFPAWSWKTATKCWRTFPARCASSTSASCPATA